MTFGSGEAETPSRYYVTRDLSKPCCGSTRSSRNPVGNVRRVMTTAVDRADMVERRHRIEILCCRDTIEETSLQISTIMLVSLGADFES